MNLNITKEEGADNDLIIDFIKQRANNVEYETLSEEILLSKFLFIISDLNSVSMTNLYSKNVN